MKSTKKLTTDVFIQRCNVIHNNFYDYSKVEYENCNTKVKIGCPKHGVFEQRPADHLNGVGCGQCGLYKNTRLKSRDTFLKEAMEIHGDHYNYSKVEYINSTGKVTIICPIHGEFQQLPYTHLIGRGCKACGVHKNVFKKTKEEFMEKCHATHGDKYDYSKVEYVNLKTKITIGCPIHGEFQQTPYAHLKSGGCNKCGNAQKGISKRLSIEEFTQKANMVHNNTYDYASTNYVRSSDVVEILCEKHGVFNQIANNHLSGSKCPKCSATISRPEIDIKKLLDDMGVEYIHQDRKLISPFELDFVIPSHKIAIEFNGIYYHSEDMGGKGRTYHMSKTRKCEDAGYQLLHIFENEYINKYDILKGKLLSIFNKNEYKIYARKCQVKEIPPKIKKRFNEKYHIQGDSQSCVNLGLFYKNRLVQVMTFSKRRKALGASHMEGNYELSRMCSIRRFTIVGGASKLLRYFEKTYKPKKLVSYADKRWSRGNVYYKMGLELIGSSPPSYWYFYKKGNDKPLYHRYKFAKHTLNRQLPIYDSSLTEWENMKNNDYDRIWDSGCLCFQKLYS